MTNNGRTHVTVTQTSIRETVVLNLVLAFLLLRMLRVMGARLGEKKAKVIYVSTGINLFEIREWMAMLIYHSPKFTRQKIGLRVRLSYFLEFVGQRNAY
jgi:hypothetical protein